jgi:hypothetical protein
MVRQIWGGVPVSMPTESQRSKEIQLDVTNALICNGVGQRRLLVSKQLSSYDPDKRGILYVMRNFAWPDNPKKHQIIPDDKHLEHAADAILYACAAYFNPPKFIKTSFLS